MEIPDEQIPAHMHDYLKKTGRKRIPGTRKLCRVMEAKKTLLYTPVLKWYADTIFTNNERTVDKAMPSPYLEDLEEIWGAYEIREEKRYVIELISVGLQCISWLNFGCLSSTMTFWTSM